MALIVTPSDGSDCVPVPLKYPQAFTGLRIPEPDIAGAGKEPALVRMPCETLHMGSRSINQSQATSRADFPQPDGTIAASRQDPSLAWVENSMINPVPMTLEFLQHFAGRQLPKPDNPVPRSREESLSRLAEVHRTDIGPMTSQDTKALT